MRTFLIRLALLAAPFMAIPAHAQRIAFVDTKYILDQMPDYNAAQQELDRLSTKWQGEIEDRYEQIGKLREAYNAEAILLTEEMKRSRQEDIQKKEQEARDLQKRRFGVNGDLFKKRQELIQPIQDRIYEAIKEVAGTSYVAIFDLGATGNNVLFASDKYDKSDSVLRKLGIRPGKGGDAGGGNDTEDENPFEDEKTPERGDDGGEDMRPGGNSRGNETKSR